MSRPPRLTPEQVRALRQRCFDGALRKQVAWEFGVSTRTVTDIAAGKTYKYVDGPLPGTRDYERVTPETRAQMRLYIEAGGDTHACAHVFGRSTSVVYYHTHDLLRARREEKQK